VACTGRQSGWPGAQCLEEVSMADERYAPISLHAIPVRGGWGAAFLILVLVTAMLIELEPLRPLVLSAGLGVVFGVWRIVRRRRSGGSQY
jgi:hypothetical protein